MSYQSKIIIEDLYKTLLIEITALYRDIVRKGAGDRRTASDLVRKGAGR